MLMGMLYAALIVHIIYIIVHHFPFCEGLCVILYDDVCVRVGILYNVSAWGLRVARSDKMGNSQEPQDVGRARDTGLTFFVYYGHCDNQYIFLAEFGDL